MASTPIQSNVNRFSSNTENKNYTFALTSLTSLFFMWGFITCLNDILIPHLKAIFDLSYSQAMLVQFCFFSAYFLVSIPAGKIVKKVGFQKGIVLGLIVAAIGCFAFYPAAAMHSYPVFLLALFILASGITILQVSANPYVSILGNPETASSRLTMTQAFNSLGTTVAPFFGAYLILDQVAESMSVAQQAESVQLPYVLLAGLLLILAAIFSYIKLPVIEHIEHIEESVAEKPIAGSAWEYRHLVLGAIGIFVYVGAEVSIGSFLVSFFNDPNIAGLEESQAAKYIAYYWGGAMVGRFIGAAVMQKLAAGKVLAFNAFMAVVFIIITIFASGQIAMLAILLVGLCNSIMFPTIFSLAINGLGQHTSQGSGILCLAIVGGAILPLIQGVLADSIGLQNSFFLPIICYVFIAYYGLSGSKPVSVKV
ncbi:sugar MFS transporter [Colwellia sp. MB02u-18]|uniref:sugar MFS transporter n=1 Tax=unclassified Colwellia TaxID=196834 RepID=UPI0015F36DA8|nr:MULTISPECIES: sugar MFS transporter [unclassified Colwellia]MBA6225101.1 sugar MFS transporter [Colwellia sp. MB3u-45]MBA6268611.1 sugar MFS transporter [Colwellia sp. MB3u-43]MBA6321042.1 sugar MFS transporter [Colwellia sp. MB02u-19]MBA6325595.1 sugar MFS transporter [Colwellia sp. MB02u-18]MBA6332070.1 sugar MFS transporter [Colwellia sp. MB02u-12]